MEVRPTLRRSQEIKNQRPSLSGVGIIIARKIDQTGILGSQSKAFTKRIPPIGVTSDDIGPLHGGRVAGRRFGKAGEKDRQVGHPVAFIRKTGFEQLANQD